MTVTFVERRRCYLLLDLAIVVVVAVAGTITKQPKEGPGMPAAVVVVVVVCETAYIEDFVAADWLLVVVAEPSCCPIAVAAAAADSTLVPLVRLWGLGASVPPQEGLVEDC
jgi:hypothetical protein